MEIIIDGSFLQREMIRMYGTRGNEVYQAKKAAQNGVAVVDTTNLGKVMGAGYAVLESFELFKDKLEENASQVVRSHPSFLIVPNAARTEFFRVCELVRIQLEKMEQGPLALMAHDLEIVSTPSDFDPRVWLEWVLWMERKEAQLGKVRLQVLWRDAIKKGNQVAMAAAMNLDDTRFEDLCGENTDNNGGSFRESLLQIWKDSKQNPALAEAYRLLRDAIANTKNSMVEFQFKANQLAGFISAEDQIRARLVDNSGQKTWKPDNEGNN